MIEQKLRQPGLLAETPRDPIFPLSPDLVLVFFPTPGIFVHTNLQVPNLYFSHPVTLYNEDAKPFNEKYIFLPAVLASQYESGMNASGIIYEKGVLRFAPDLIHMLAEQEPEVIEHRS